MQVTARSIFVLVGVLMSVSPPGSADASLARSDVSSVAPRPDRMATYIGGAAARLHDLAEGPLPGDVFLLMAESGSSRAARAYDRTSFQHDGGVHDETRESNRSAAMLVEGLTATDVEPRDLTSAPGGGPSGGLVYTLGYLDLVTDGGFTDGLRVAATGTIRPDGYVGPISAIDEKVAAAALADVEVLFTASVPGETTIAAHGARFVAEMSWVPTPGTSLAEQRTWDRYREWGASRPEGMDVVAVRHIGDVAAYLCGVGSEDACAVVEELTMGDDSTTIASVGRIVERVRPARHASGSRHATIRDDRACRPTTALCAR